MNWGVITKWLVVGVILIIAVFDLVALTVGGSDATISHVVGVEGSFHSPLIPFALGFIMGHLFWPQKRKKLSEPE